MTSPQLPPLWTTEDVAKFTGLSVDHVNRLRQQKKGPAYHKMGHLIRYSPRRVIEWVATQTVETNDSIQTEK